MWRSLITVLCATGTVLGRVPRSITVFQTSKNSLQTDGKPSAEDSSKCPNGFVPLGSRDCYYISSGVANWLNAQHHCEEINATLAELSEMDMHKQLKKYLTDKQSNHVERWIGGRYNWGTRAWEWGISGSNYTYDRFGKLKSGSDRVDKEWHCVVMNPQREYDWTAKSCFEDKHFICHKRRSPTVSSGVANELWKIDAPIDVQPTSPCPEGFVLLGKRNCFYISSGVANWLNAQFFCEDRNATLAELPRKHLNRKLKKYLMGQRSNGFERWIGARYNWGKRVWEWGITGRNMTYQGFSKLKSETDRVDEEWHCAVMNPERKYNWAARNCAKEKHYICHKRANLSGKKNRKSPNGKRRQRIKGQKNRKGNSGTNLTDRNDILPLDSEREFRGSKTDRRSRSGPAWKNESELKQRPHKSLTRWAPGTKHSDRLKPVKSKDPTLPELWVGRKKAEIMTSSGNYVKGSDEESSSKPPIPAGIAPSISDSIEIETEMGNMLTQFGGHMFV